MEELKFPAVEPFTNVEWFFSKDQALKVLEESAELVEATKAYGKCQSKENAEAMIDEAMDVYQALGNFLACLNDTDIAIAYERCRQRNAARGRY